MAEMTGSKSTASMWYYRSTPLSILREWATMRFLYHHDHVSRETAEWFAPDNLASRSATSVRHLEPA